MKHPWSSQSFAAAARNAGRPLQMIEASEAIARNIKSSNPDLPVIFTLNHLANIIGVRSEDLQKVVSRQVDSYRIFRVKKRGIPGKTPPPSRKFRTICVPDPFLMKTQRWIAQNILNAISPHEASFAFTPGKDLVDAAKWHTSAKWLVKMDVRNFFESITEKHAYHSFRSFGYTALLSFQMARICTRLPERDRRQAPEYRAFRDKSKIVYRPLATGHLPQGAPSSPMLANLAMRRLDTRLTKIAKAEGWTYTRYADDLALSRHTKTSRRSAQRLTKIIELELNRYGLINHKQKTKISPPGARKVMLGVLIDNDKPRLTKAYRNNIETHLYALLNSKIGIKSHLSNRGFSSTIGMRRHIEGLISFAHQVDPNYAKDLYSKFNRIDWSQ